MNVPARPRRSDATKAAIRSAARDRFAADGYERATIRAIAADAGIDPAMVIRYFGTKERLFVAAAEFELRLPDPESVPRDQAGLLLARHFLALWERDESLTALLRSAVTHPAAADRMREIFAGQVVGLAARLCPDPAQASARAGLAASQILGTALCRFVLHLPPVVQMPRPELVHWLGGTLQHYLTSREGF